MSATEFAGKPAAFVGCLLSNPKLRALLPLMRFGLVGLLNSVFGYTAFALLTFAGAWPGAALIGATIAGVVFNFQTSRQLVFRSNGNILRFVIVYSVVLVLNWGGLRGLRWCGQPALISQALLILPMAALAFLGQRRFVFGSARQL